MLNKWRIKMNLNEILNIDFDEDDFKPVLNRITCNDGVSLSVQASKFHYCEPRLNEGPYKAVEVGYPSIDPPDSWEEYFDGNWEDDRTGSVYGYVPIDMVERFIVDHGGLKTGE